MGWALHYDLALERELTPAEAASLERLCELRSLRLERVTPTGYRGFFQLGSGWQLVRIVAWLREVEQLLPNASFEVSEDHSITQKCRPSEVDLEVLRSRARAEAEEPDAPDEQDLAVEALLEEAEASSSRSRRLEEGLAQARRDFAVWKNRKT